MRAGLTVPYPALLRPVLYFSGATALICGIVCSLTFWSRRLEAGLAVLVLGAAATLMIISYGRLMIEPTRSYASLARNIERLAPGARLICYPRYIESLPFYCRRRVILVGAKTELTYGAEHAVRCLRVLLHTARRPAAAVEGASSVRISNRSRSIGADSGPARPVQSDSFGLEEAGVNSRSSKGERGMNRKSRLRGK